LCKNIYIYIYVYKYPFPSVASLLQIHGLEVLGNLAHEPESTGWQQYLHHQVRVGWHSSPENLKWHLKMMVSKRNLLFQGLLFGFHVKFLGCKRFLKF